MSDDFLADVEAAARAEDTPDPSASQGPTAPPAVAVQAELAARVTDARPKPEHLLTPAERADRMRQHAAALSAGMADPPPPPPERPRPGEETELIHFIADGLSFAGQVWFRGQELEFVVGSPRWHQAQSWLNLEDWQQEERWGEVKFRRGPWRGRRYVDALRDGPEGKMMSLDGNQVITGPTEAELLRAEEMERRRGRGVPSMVLR